MRGDSSDGVTGVRGAPGGGEYETEESGWLVKQGLQDWQSKSSCLPRPCFSQANDVPPWERRRSLGWRGRRSGWTMRSVRSRVERGGEGGREKRATRGREEGESGTGDCLRSS